MTSRKSKGPFERVVDAISDFMGKPLSDESFEVPTAKKVKKAKADARGSTRRKAKRAPAKRKRASAKRKSGKR